MKDKVLKLMASNIHCVISTLSPESEPQSALVGFSEDEQLCLVIGTSRDSRKHRNISAHPQVSIVVADEQRKLEVQYEGEAKVLSPSQLGDRLKLHFKKLPTTEKRLQDPNQVWINISPVWVRYVDASVSPVKYEEMSFR